MVGGGGRFGYVFLTFLDNLLYYGYNTGLNNSVWEGVWGSSPRIFLLELVENLAILEGTLACYYVTIRVETAHFETDWYIETNNIHKYL